MLKNKFNSCIWKDIKKNLYKFKFIIILILLIMSFFLVFIDIWTYFKNINGQVDFKNIILSIAGIFSWWSFWTILMVSISASILIYYEILFFKKRKKYSDNLLSTYNYLKLYTISYVFLTSFVYNFIQIFIPKLITDNPYSLQSILEHKVALSVYATYFIISANKDYKINNLNNWKYNLTIICLSTVIPIMYIIYATVFGDLSKNGFPYFFLNYHKEGMKYFAYVLLSLSMVLVTISLLFTLTIKDITFKKNTKLIQKKI